MRRILGGKVLFWVLLIITCIVLLFYCFRWPQSLRVRDYLCENLPSFIECVSERKCETFSQIHIRTNLCLWLSKLHMCATLMYEQSRENWVWHSCRWNMQRVGIGVGTVCCMVCMCVCVWERCHCFASGGFIKATAFQRYGVIHLFCCKVPTLLFLSLCLSSLFLSSSLAPTTLRWEIKERDHMDHSGPFDV